MIENNEILENYDIILVDMYGVIKGQNGLIAGAAETLKNLVKKGKIVSILSNSTELSNSAIKGYEKLGLQKGVHYNEIITSGEFINSKITAGNLKFSNGKEPKNIFILGVKHHKLFDNSKYKIVETPQEADSFYISIPALTESEKDELNNSNQTDKNRNSSEIIFKSSISDTENNNYYNFTDPNLFRKKLEELKGLNLPGISANPDLKALGNTNNGRYVVRQGFISELYKEIGGEILEFGKPHSEIYGFAIENIAKNNPEIADSINNKRIAMIGDTIRTDIFGAFNSGKKYGYDITGILTLTGIEAKTMLEKQGFTSDFENHSNKITFQQVENHLESYKLEDNFTAVSPEEEKYLTQKLKNFTKLKIMESLGKQKQ